MDAFDYVLPEHAIAQVPVEPRSSARLLVDRGSTVQHRTVADLPQLLHPGDLVVVNSSRVMAARFVGHKETGGKVEVLFCEQREDRTWEALVKPGRRVTPGTLVRGAGVEVEVLDRLDGGKRLVAIRCGDPFSVGAVPLPPYIHEPLADSERYQTVFADRPASVAAPTAGLHLTPEVLAPLDVVCIDLAVGIDTFRPITADDPVDHEIHTEVYSVDDAVLEACRSAQRVVAVGTTTVRALEAAARGEHAGRTDLFIRSGFEFRIVDVLLTNFHLPRSSLLLLVDAFIGDRWRELYDIAIAERYRFLSFGDAMLLSR